MPNVLLPQLLPNIHFQAKQCRRLFSASVISKTPERFGTAKGESGWTWDGKDRVGMGGKDVGKSNNFMIFIIHFRLKFSIYLKITGVGTEVKPDLGKDKTYKAPEFFGYDNYSFYDIEVGVVDEGKRCPQPESGLTEYW